MAGFTGPALRIAFNALAATRGGAITQLPRFLNAMRLERPTWDLLVYTSQDAATAELPGLDVRQLDATAPHRRLAEELVLLDRRARQAGADCVVNLLNTGAVRPTVPTLTWQRNALYFDRRWLSSQSRPTRSTALLRRAMSIAACRGSAEVLVPSEAMRRYVRDWRFTRNMGVQVVPHGVDVDAFSFRARDEVRSPLVLGVMGHAAAHRGLDVAVRVLHQLVASGHRAELRLTVPRHGNPAFQALVDDVGALVDALGLSSVVRFGGSVDDAAQWYDELDVLLVPSHCESFGFPVVEALASGVPVVASRIAALEEFGGLVRLAEPGDVAAYTRCIRDFLDRSPEERHDEALSGLEFVSGLTWSKSAAAVARSVEAAVNRTGSAWRSSATGPANEG